MKKRTGFISKILCVAVVLSLALSAAFIITHADHDCTSNHCEICRYIERCDQTLKKTWLDTVTWIKIAFAGLFYVLITIDSQETRTFKTLVSIRVKLSC